jgi:hypothetical protein
MGKEVGVFRKVEFMKMFVAKGASTEVNYSEERLRLLLLVI